jgi:hypothetical protein
MTTEEHVVPDKATLMKMWDDIAADIRAHTQPRTGGEVDERMP